jgi:hypothetical protein
LRVHIFRIQHWKLLKLRECLHHVQIYLGLSPCCWTRRFRIFSDWFTVEMSLKVCFFYFYKILVSPQK